MRSRTIGLVLMGLLAAPLTARADVIFTPFVGTNLNGTASSPVGTLLGDPSRMNFGGSVAVMSGGVFGIEADFGYSPRFFGSDVQIAGLPISLVRNNVTTGMVNFTVGVPIQGSNGVGFRPYAVAGIGVIRQRLDVAGGILNHTSSDLGYDFGGGAMLFFGEHIGLRGDLRYFRTAGDNPFASLVELERGSFNFTRASVGVTLRY